jgi:FixJ family two-component response regulator
MSADAKLSEKPLVCVVDDDYLLRDSTLRLLRSFGFRAQTFASAEEFWNSGYLQEAACLILDMRMPGMGGLELQRKLVASHYELPVIFITAYEEEGTRAQAQRDGVGVLLIKPFGAQVLVNAVNEALNLKWQNPYDAER